MKALVLYLLFSAIGLIGSASAGAKSHSDSHVKKVMIPQADKFVPFAMEIRAGDTVEWMNSDTDDHTVVSDDAFTSPPFRKMNTLILGTDNNGGQPGVLRKTFHHPGTFVYYCRFHSKLDKDNQPIAPGPDGGIQDDQGNFGTPMMGVITVMPY